MQKKDFEMVSPFASDRDAHREHRTFRAEFDPAKDSVLVDPDFYVNWQKSLRLGRYYFLTDPRGDCFGLLLEKSRRQVKFTDGLDRWMKWYRLPSAHSVELYYRGDNDFDIKIYNNYELEIDYPPEPLREVIEIESDIDDQNEDENTSWIVKLTKAQVSGTNHLVIPARVVRDVLDNDGEFIEVVDEEGQRYECKFLRNKRRETELYLGKGWYQFVRDKGLRVGL